ncbi:trehalose-phosphatase [Corynebacterium sp. zg254]|uniref:Trehalose 6-phosphate phosphatase n=1 Tax=Corynebacterium zhongnanshanii TaxID=2768834 RepID=A0ABQ6VCY0_9CORY|nr:trehalose-phosphatase [Corynebacterium zhongnanshanii]MCR5914750.1 trehalose-phosphatase [Corynebacterium sp. zg254]
MRFTRLLLWNSSLTSQKKTSREKTVTTHAPDISASDIEALAAADCLLVAMDFDGTMAPFHDDPMSARAEDGCIESLKALAAMDDTIAMIVSGRNLAQLREVTGLSEGNEAGIHLIGSHGAEPAGTGFTPLSEAQRELYESLAVAAEAAASLHPGLWVERKPLSVGLHSRTCDNKDVADQAHASFLSHAQGMDNVMITQGKAVIEVAVDSTSKGDYISAFREEHCIPTVVFAGDDTTDESVMRVLHTQRTDMGIKVGAGASRANRRLSGTVAVRDFLAQLVEARRLD